MTHASGITANVELSNAIKLAKESNVRCLQVSIVNEQLSVKSSDNVNGSFEDDFNVCVEKYLLDTECCYIVYRTDEKNPMGFNWIFMHWVPDNASVRDKMLYASTRSTMKKEFGEAYFVEDFTGYDKVDLLYSGYVKHLESKSAPPPLSQSELDLIDIKKAERETALGDGHRTLKCMGFPPTDELIQDLKTFTEGSVDFLEMSIEVANERIRSEGTQKQIDCDEMRGKIDPEKPRYFLFRFRHQFENSNYQSIIFIYNMPGYSASVKQRMLYSSSKAPFLELLQDHFELAIDKRLELIAGDLGDLITDNLLLNLHPPKVDNRISFSKPKGPSNRGPKRLLKD